MEVDPSTSTDPSTLYGAFPRPVVRLKRLDICEITPENNNVTPPSKRRQTKTKNLTSPMSTVSHQPDPEPSTSRLFEMAQNDEDEEEFCPISRASAQFNKVMEQFNCLLKIYNDKNANFQVELSKLLQDLMVKIVTPSDAAQPDKNLNFGRLALILQGSTTIYSKKVEFLADLFAQFLVRLSSEIGKAAIGITGNAEGDNEESQTQRPDDERPLANKKKRQQSSAAAFSLVDIKLEKHTSKSGSTNKIKLRPKMFSILYENSQCDKDKQRIVTLNPELNGETTWYRLWAPISEETGLLNPDCKDSVDSDCDSGTHESNVESHLVSEEILQDLDPPDISTGMDHDSDANEPDDVLLETPPRQTDQTEILGSKENNSVEKESSEVICDRDDPWKTLAPGDTIEDLRLQPQPPIPKFKSRVVLEIEEAYFKSWFKEAKKGRGCFGDENIHEGLALEKEGKLLDHPDQKNKRKRIDIDSDRSSKKSIKSIEELFLHHDSDDEDVLGFSDEKPVYQNAISSSTIELPSIDPADWSADLDLPGNEEEDRNEDNTGLELPSDEEDDDDDFDLGMEIEIEDPMSIAARVDGFMKFMKQSFAEQEKKPKFSFKTYCESILGAFPPAEQGGSELMFKQLVNDNSENDGVARQLLATLMLANHKNVEIDGNTEGNLANDTLSLRLLNRTRNLPTFEEDEQFNS